MAQLVRSSTLQLFSDLWGRSRVVLDTVEFISLLHGWSCYCLDQRQSFYELPIKRASAVEISQAFMTWIPVKETSSFFCPPSGFLSSLSGLSSHTLTFQPSRCWTAQFWTGSKDLLRAENRLGFWGDFFPWVDGNTEERVCYGVGMEAELVVSDLPKQIQWPRHMRNEMYADTVIAKIKLEGQRVSPVSFGGPALTVPL